MKLLVCDDDISTIDVIESQLDLKSLSVTEVLRAYNGEMAKEIIAKKNPELILCDIGMPKVNGIEVLKFVYENGYNSEFSFITCYEDFEYAHQAIRYGATDYITKPFDLNEIRICLQKMVANAYKKQILLSSYHQVRHDSLHTSVLRQISDGIYSTDRSLINDFLKSNGIEFTADSRWQIVFSCFDMTDAIKRMWSRDLLLFTTARIHDEALVEYIGSAYTVVNSDDRFIWCICFIPEKDYDSNLTERCQKLIDFSNDHMSIKPVMLISDVFDFYQTAEVVRGLYDKIRKIRFAGGQVFSENQEINYHLDDINFNENQLLWHLKKRDEAGYEEYMNLMLEKTDGSKDSLRYLSKELTGFFFTVFSDNGLSNNVIFEDENMVQLEKKSDVSREDFLKYAMALLSLQQSRMNTAIESEDIIGRAKKFVDENYRENIDRDDVAAVAFVTPNYLSKLFRNNMGMNLREYINQLRIEEAKRLLLSTTMSVSEIASYVGYYNISYFSTVFHKVIGVSPVDWRNMNQKEGTE